MLPAPNLDQRRKICLVAVFVTQTKPPKKLCTPDEFKTDKHCHPGPQLQKEWMCDNKDLDALANGSSGGSSSSGSNSFLSSNSLAPLNSPCGEPTSCLFKVKQTEGMDPDLKKQLMLDNMKAEADKAGMIDNF